MTAAHCSPQPRYACENYPGFRERNCTSRRIPRFYLPCARWQRYLNMRGPGAANLDYSLLRSFHLFERVQLQSRSEAFNLTNAPHFGNPGANISILLLNPDGTVKSPGSHTVVSATTARGARALTGGSSASGYGSLSDCYRPMYIIDIERVSFATRLLTAAAARARCIPRRGPLSSVQIDEANLETCVRCRRSTVGGWGRMRRTDVR